MLLLLIIAYHGDDGGDEYHCAHVVMFNLFEYVLYCFKCDSVDDDDKMVIWCTIAQIWCTIAPGVVVTGNKCGDYGNRCGSGNWCGGGNWQQVW